MKNREQPLPIGIVLVAHGGLAKELLNTVEYILGMKQNGILTVCVEVCSNLEEKQKEVQEAVKQADCGSGVILVTDLHGSTPANLAIQAAMNDENHTVIHGANLALLIKLIKSRHLPIGEAKLLALSSGRQYVSTFDDTVV